MKTYVNVYLLFFLLEDSSVVLGAVAPLETADVLVAVDTSETEAVEESVEQTFNVVFSYFGSKKIEICKYPWSHERNPRRIVVDHLEKLNPNAAELKSIAEQPIHISGQERTDNWIEKFLSLHGNKYWFCDRKKSTLTATETDVVRKAGFVTRSFAEKQGLILSDAVEFNNTGRSCMYTCWRKSFLSGEKGKCLLLSLYYISEEFTEVMVDEFTQSHHEKICLEDGEVLYVTNGTGNIFTAINHRLKRSVLTKIYPLEEYSHLNGKENKLFGTLLNPGKFLIEICSCNPTSNGMITHYVSFDSLFMEIYDPTNPIGPIVVETDSNDVFLVNETLRLHHNTCNFLTIVQVWKLEVKQHSIGKRCIGVVGTVKAHAKKRKGAKRFQSLKSKSVVML